MERLLLDAGVGGTMRVLDVGCGVGDVTIMIARLLGEGGHVVGVDIDASALEKARARVDRSTRGSVEFALGDISELPASFGGFDAVVARRVLMYQADAASTLSSMRGVLKPGGLVIVQEHDAARVLDERGLFPLHERVAGWIWQTVAREGADVHMGSGLYGLLRDAGVSVAGIQAEVVVETPESASTLAVVVRAILPRMVSHGVVRDGEVDVDDLERELSAEAASAGTVRLGDLVFSAWGRLG